MNKRLKKLVVFGICFCMAISGCGMKTGETVPYAFITAGTTVEESKNASAAYSAIAKYAEEQGERHASYVAVSSDPAAIEAAFEQAVAAGAKRIIVEGSPVMNEILYRMQREYRGVRFLCLDGAPVNDKGEIEYRGNTVSVDVDSAQAGYLAGYAAVCAGYTSLGFLCGTKTEEALKSGNGFIQGVEAACADLNMGSGSVTVKCWVRGTDEVDPSMKENLVEWYRNGTQIIFSDGGSYDNVLLAAAQQMAGCIIGNGICEIGNNVLMYVDKNFNELVYNELGAMAGTRFEGGKRIEAGAAYNAFRIDWNSQLVSGIDQGTLDTVYTKMSKEEFRIDGSNDLSSRTLPHVIVSEFIPSLYE